MEACLSSGGKNDDKTLFSCKRDLGAGQAYPGSQLQMNITSWRSGAGGRYRERKAP